MGPRRIRRSDFLAAVAPEAVYTGLKLGTLSRPVSLWRRSRGQIDMAAGLFDSSVPMERFTLQFAVVLEDDTCLSGLLLLDNFYTGILELFQGQRRIVFDRTVIGLD